MKMKCYPDSDILEVRVSDEKLKVSNFITRVRNLLGTLRFRKTRAWTELKKKW